MFYQLKINNSSCYQNKLCNYKLTYFNQLQVKVFVIPSQDSQHIMKMISKQKSTKSKGGGAFVPIAQAPKRRSMNSGSNWK